MASFYLDSSALAKVFHTEAGSAVVRELVFSSTSTSFISRLSVAEIKPLFAGKVRAGVIDSQDAASLQRRFLEDISMGLFRVVALTSDHYDQAAADKVLCKSAAIEGIPVIDPESDISA